MVHKTLQANYRYASKLTFELLNKDQEWNSASVIFGSTPGSKLKKIGFAKLSIRILHLNAVLWIQIRSLFPDPAKMKNNIHNYNFISLLIMCRKVRFICSSKGYKLVDMLKIPAIKVESGSGTETHLSRTGTGSGINHSGFTTQL